MEKILSLQLNDKRIKVITWFLAAILTAFILFIPKARADSADDEKFLKSMAETILKGTSAEIDKVIKGEDTYGQFYKFCTGTNVKTTLVKDENGKQQNQKLGIYSAFSGFITALKSVIIIYMLIISAGHLISEIGKGVEGKDAILKMFVNIGVTSAFILKLDVIVVYLIQVAEYISLSISLTANEQKLNEQVTALVSAVGFNTGDGKLAYMSAFSRLFIPWVASLATNAAGIFVILQTSIEIAIRKMWIPLAVVDIYQEGMRSTGVKNLKKIAACVLKLGVCAMIASLASRLMAGNMDITKGVGAGFSLAVTMVTINVTAIGTMFKADSMVNDFMGA